MRYRQIRSMDISNGGGIGIALFVQGCSFHCKGCFNKETWDFDSGNLWTKESKESFMGLADKEYIHRISILGGEPLHPHNIAAIYNLCYSIKERYPQKLIWLYTGYTFENILSQADKEKPRLDDFLRKSILSYIDILVDGQFIEELKNRTLAFRGSSNQRIIDVRKTLEKNEMVLYEIGRR